MTPYAAGIVTALLTAIFLTQVLGVGLGLMSLMVVVGLGLIGYGIAKQIQDKGRSDAG